MKHSLRTHNVTMTAIDQQQMDEKLERLHKHLQPPFTMDVVLDRKILKSQGNSITCTITIEHGKHVFHAQRISHTMQTALDQTIDALHQELKKEHDKHKRHGGGVQR